MSLSLTVAGVVHGCKKVQELGPLGWSDALAHVYDAVHGYVRIILHQATISKENVKTQSFNTGQCLKWWKHLLLDFLPQQIMIYAKLVLSAFYSRPVLLQSPHSKMSTCGCALKCFLFSNT